MSRYSGFTDRDIRDLRDATERERMAAHYDHNEGRRRAAVEKLSEISNEIARRRHTNRENRRRKP